MNEWRPPLRVALAAGVLVAVAACAPRRPTAGEVAAAIHDCGIPAGGVSLTFGKDRTFSVQGREDITYKQFTCVVEWAQSRGFKSKIALIRRSEAPRP
jgi:hypothetical protein